MPIYLLPTKSPIRYRGNRGDHFRQLSTSPDCDGRRAWHIETLAGDRFTIPIACGTDRMRKFGPDFQTATIASITGAPILEFPIVPMTQAVYDDWLSRIRAARLANA